MSEANRPIDRGSGSSPSAQAVSSSEVDPGLQEVDAIDLAQRIYELMKKELIIERERLGRRSQP